jgi:hypothetical protein
MAPVQAPLIPRKPSSPIHPKPICTQLPNSLFSCRSFKFKPQNSAGVKAQFESRYPAPDNITLMPVAVIFESFTGTLLALGYSHELRC